MNPGSNQAGGFQQNAAPYGMTGIGFGGAPRTVTGSYQPEYYPSYGHFPIQPTAPHTATYSSTGNRALYVGGIGPEVTQEDLNAAFSAHGLIESVKLVPAKACAFVTFTSPDFAANAMREMQGRRIRSYELKLGWGKQQEQQHAPTQVFPGQHPAMPQIPHSRPWEMNPHQNVAQFPGAVHQPPPTTPLSFSQPSVIPPTPFAPPPIPQNSRPHLIPPPQDQELKKTIDKLIEHISQKGDGIEISIRTRDSANPKFSFLFGGEGHDYYNFLKLSIKSGLTMAQIQQLYDANPSLPHEAEKALNPPPATNPTHEEQILVDGLNPADLLKLYKILDSLDGSKDSIKSGKDWILENAHLGRNLVETIAKRIGYFDSFNKRLFVIYLINDVTYHCTRHEKFDALLKIFIEAAPSIFYAAYSPRTHDAFMKLSKVLTIWKDRGIITETKQAEIESSMNMSQPPVFQPPPPQPAQSITRQPENPPEASPAAPLPWQTFSQPTEDATQSAASFQPPPLPQQQFHPVMPNSTPFLTTGGVDPSFAAFAQYAPFSQQPNMFPLGVVQSPAVPFPGMPSSLAFPPVPVVPLMPPHEITPDLIPVGIMATYFKSIPKPAPYSALDPVGVSTMNPSAIEVTPDIQEKVERFYKLLSVPNKPENTPS